MKAAKQPQPMRMYAVLTIAAVTVLSLGLVATASDRNDNQQQYGQQGQNRDVDQDDQSQAQSQTRDLRLEQQIAGALRQAGYGAQGEIMILAAGNQVTLLGTVPGRDQKSGTEQIVKGVARGKSVSNRPHVAAQARQIDDNQLQNRIHDQLRGDLRQDVQVSVQNGTATLQGSLDNWRQVADAIDAAFAAGASRVNSQFTVGAGAPSYGYIPGQQAPSGRQGFEGQQGYAQGQPGATGRAGQASPSDLRLAQQVASQLRQQLPPGQNVQLIQPQSIYVSVSQGTVTLHGYIQNNNQKQQAQQVVQQLRQRLTGIQNIQVMRPGAIYVMAANGNVMLHGFITNPNIKQQVNQIARAVPGVRNVTDDLRIIRGAGTYPSYGYVPGQPQQGADARTQYIAAQRDQMESGQQGQMGFSQSDMTLAHQVTQRLWQQLTGFQNVQVMTPGTIYVKASNGTITLEGYVPDNRVKQQAEQLARAITGVQNVRNSLSIAPAAGASAMGYIPGSQPEEEQFENEQFQGRPDQTDSSSADEGRPY